MVGLVTVMNWVKTLTDATPQAIELFNEVKQLFGPSEQADLQATLEEVQGRNDAGHTAFQNRQP